MPLHGSWAERLNTKTLIVEDLDNGNGFWARHVLLPLALMLPALFLVETTRLDAWLADRWYALGGGAWAFRDHWLAYDLIHHHGKQMIIAFALLLIGLLIASSWWRVIRPWRRRITYLLVCMLILPGLVAFAKHSSPVHCPWNISRYGGAFPFRHLFEYSMGPGGYCFPSGHASGGFALISMYFAALGAVRRPALFLLPGLLVGWTFALGQQARGAHFLSHDLWTLSFCWFGALALFLLIRPAGRDRPLHELSQGGEVRR